MPLLAVVPSLRRVPPTLTRTQMMLQLTVYSCL